MKLTPKQITLIVMCALLLIMVIMMAVVVGKVKPVIDAFVNTPDSTESTEPSTQPTGTGTEPSVQPTTLATEPGHEHTFTLTKTVAAGCETVGYSLYSCSCGKTEMRDYKEATGHTYGAGKMVSATCESQGYKEFKCTTCGYVDKRDVVAATGHDYDLKISKEASCTEEGYDEYVCANCGATERRNQQDALGHKYKKVGNAVAPTCTTDGYTVYVCTVCDDEKHDDIVEATGHSFSEWEIKSEPGTNNPGQQTRKCQNKGCTETETRDCELELTVISSDNQSYVIDMVAKNSKGQKVIVYTYTVYNEGGFTLTFSYDTASRGRVLAKFTDKTGAEKVYSLEPDSVITIDKNGNRVSGSPTEPSEATQPSDGSGASGQSENGE